MEITKEFSQYVLFDDIIPSHEGNTDDEEGLPEMHDPDKLRRLPFAGAAEVWLATRQPYLKARSFKVLSCHVAQLCRFFGKVPAHKIHIGQIRQYQKARVTNEGCLWIHRAGASVVNHELVALKGILKRCGEWSKIESFYEALPLPRPKKPKVMTDEEEMLLFSVAATDPGWELAYRVASISVNTGAAGAELRNLRLQDLQLDSRQPGFHIQGETTKNRFRVRWVPLNATALKHILRCAEIAKGKGSVSEAHYLFPFRVVRGRWDPTRPASDSWLRREWKDMVTAAGVAHITPHCMRHQHATVSLELGESEFTVAKRLGHRNPTMLREVYGHLRQDTQAMAVAAIDPEVRFGPKGARRGAA